MPKKAWKYTKAPVSKRLAYDLFLRENSLSDIDYPLDRIVRDELGRITDCYRADRFADLGNSILGWACWSIVYRSTRTGEEETILIEYKVDGWLKLPLHSWVAVRTAS